MNQNYRGQNYKVYIEEIIGMRIMKEVGVSLEKDNTEKIIEGMT